MSFDIELPGGYVDAVVIDAPGERPQLINRNPGPDETGVALDAHITLDITDPDGTGIDLATTQVWIADVLAFDGSLGSVFLPGFAGAASTYAVIDGGATLRITIDYENLLASLDIIEVRVVASVTGLPQYALDERYQFRCQDLSSPYPTSAVALGLRRIRVTFNEDVVQASAAGGNDALNPNNWSFTRSLAPSVSVEPVTIESVTSSSVDVLTDIDLTPGITYVVFAAGVEDLFGNAIAAPFDNAEFLAWAPAVPEAREFDLYGMLPEINRREDTSQDLRKFIACLQEVADHLLYEVDRFIDILDPELADEQWVDLMLADLGDPFDGFDLDIVDKRRLAQSLVALYKGKGTKPGIKNIVRFFLQLEVEIDEYNNLDSWSLGDDELGEFSLGTGVSYLLYSFAVVVGEVLTDSTRERLRALVEYAKPAHTHLVAIVEPTVPDILDHLELGLSELGETWILH